eukprot:11221619-Alexandrium_andersonii.AAC.1
MREEQEAWLEDSRSPALASTSRPHTLYFLAESTPSQTVASSGESCCSEASDFCSFAGLARA